MPEKNDEHHQATLFGHPVGLFTLFFVEMWERFSYYGMRALLLLYMLKGFLKYGDAEAYAAYGAYTALVYMTPFFGGMIADQLLGSRRAIVWGGLLMAAGHALMGVEHQLAFFTALALLIAGNGFFKPNISTMIGSLYPQKSPKRDSGFTIFYMGINLGAAMAPLLCGYIGETRGWHQGFGLATIGMLAGIAVFVAPSIVTQSLILLSALGAAHLLFFAHADNSISQGVNLFVMVALLSAAVVSCLALNRGGVPASVGGPPDWKRLRRHGWKVYAGTLALVPVIAMFVSGFALFTSDHKALKLVPDEAIRRLESSENSLAQVMAVVVSEVSKPAGLLLVTSGLIALFYLLRETFRMEKLPRERMYVAFALIFFWMLFGSFFEQAGSSINNFTDRNVDRVFTERSITAQDVGTTIQLQPTQKQLGYRNGSQLFTMDKLSDLRESNENTPSFEIPWKVAEDNVGMFAAERIDEIPASQFQSVNPAFILIFGLILTALWTWMGSSQPSAPFKFALGLLQLGLGFAALWYGAKSADARGMVGLEWLLIGYLFHTTGELCLSPVGLSMMTKLAPRRLVNTVMGTWFLSIAFAQYLAAIISQFTGVKNGGDSASTIPPPSETIDRYGGVFGKIAIAAIISSAVCFMLVPLLKKWMHEEAIVKE